MLRSRSHRHQVLHRRRKRRSGLLAVVALVVAVPPVRTGPPAPVLRPAALAALPADPAIRSHFIASPFGTIHAPTFRFSQPIGTGVPAPPPDLAYAMDSESLLASDDEDGAGKSQQVNRRLKGSRLVPRVRPAITNNDAASVEGAPSPPPRSDAHRTAAEAGSEASQDHETAASTPAPADVLPASAVRNAAPRDDATMRMARIYFSTVSLGVPPPAPEPWPADVLLPALEEADAAALATDAPAGPARNATIAAKGEVSGADHHAKSPAQLLDLEGAARARHEKCLADAIYFEARGEPVRGQMAVAQVVMNRVFSGYYPHNVCGVVYQNTRRHRRVRCQFSFTCDRIPDRVTEPDAWDRARRIAHEALDGDFWLNDIGKATHYHARWVRPLWVREMRKLDRIGVHTFYRPRNWGSGDKAPVWGDPEGKL